MLGFDAPERPEKPTPGARGAGFSRSTAAHRGDARLSVYICFRSLASPSRAPSTPLGGREANCARTPQPSINQAGEVSSTREAGFGTR
jgi:hypothetical protein